MGIKITVDKKTGDTKIEGVDMIGADCLSELDKVERILNTITVARQKKPEFYATYKKIKVRR